MSETPPPTYERALSDRDRALLTGLADGTLHGRRQRRAEALAQRLPDGPALLQRQRRVAATLASGPATPVSLVAPVPAARRRSSPARPRLLAAGAGALAAAVLAVLVVAFLLPSGSPTVTDASELSARPALEAAPYPRSDQPALLSARFAGVDFPNWAPTLGWVASGARRDEVDGRSTATVYYEHQGHRIAYTVVSGDALTIPADAERLRSDGVEVALVDGGDGERFAVFERGGRTCVISGLVIDESTLVDLATWRGDGAVAF